jgi:RNA polymerase sigma factor (sigma-70 family)
MRRAAIDPATPDLGEVFDREVDRLWRAVFAFTQDRAVTDDAVAEAFAQCLGRGDEVRDPRAWVWRAAFRLAAGELKARRRTERLVEVEAFAELKAESSDRLGELLALLAGLPGYQRAAAILRWYGGYGTDEIARTLGMSRATVRVHLSRARRKLRSQLTEDDA